MTLHYPDVSGYQAGISFAGTAVAMVKATEGTSYVNPDYTAAEGRAMAAKAYFTAYHFLHAGNGAAQAGHAHAVAGGTPLMLDMELEGTSRPGVADATAFIDRFRQLGGRCFLLYLPKWYWAEIGSPSLKPLTDRGMLLVSSQYTAYSDDGPGWQPYGGMTPVAWQYTASGTLNGVHPVDFNAYRGTFAEFISIATTGKKAPVATPPPPAFPVPSNVTATVRPNVTITWEPGTPASPHWRVQVVKDAGGKPDTSPAGEVASVVTVIPHASLTMPGPGRYWHREQAAENSPFTPWQPLAA